MRRRAVLACLVWGAVAVTIAAAALTPRPLEATVVRALEMDDLVKFSDVIAVSEALEKRSLYDERGHIVTDTEFEVRDGLKGSRQGQRFTVRTLGGQIGELGMRVEGSGHFELGEQHLLFAHTSASGMPVLRTVGMAQGIMRIAPATASTPAMVLPGGAGLAMMRRDATGQLVKSAGALSTPTPLSEVLSTVRTLIARTGGAR